MEKYKITAHDFDHAFQYLRVKFENVYFEFENGVDTEIARKDFWAIFQIKGKNKAVEALNSWAEQYLTSSEWDRLKAAIRKRRERVDTRNRKRNLSVTGRAKTILSDLAKRDGVTYSEVIERYLGRVLKR